MWAPRWLGYQLSRVAPLFFRWRGSPSVNAAFKVRASLGAEAASVTVRALQARAGLLLGDAGLRASYQGSRGSLA